MKYRLRAALMVAAVLAGAFSAPASAQGFPSKPVTIVVPYAAGGGTDAIARRLGLALGAHWKQSVVVENVPGADGVIGTQRVLRAPADGHTLLMQLNQMLLWKTLMPSAKIDIQTDVRLISKIQYSPLVVVVSSKFPGSTFKEFAAQCQNASTPCSWGSATQSGQLAGRQLMEAAGITRGVHVSYKGTSPMMTDVIGGHIAMGMVTVSAAATHVKAGTLKVIAIGSRERFPAARDVPTMAEQGYPVYADTWFGIMVARETPGPVADAIAAGVAAVAKDPELLKAIEAAGGAPIFNTPQQFQREVDDELLRLAPLLAKMKPAQ